VQSLIPTYFTKQEAIDREENFCCWQSLCGLAQAAVGDDPKRELKTGNGKWSAGWKGEWSFRAALHLQ
jgi:hypothetical protein